MTHICGTRGRWVKWNTRDKMSWIFGPVRFVTFFVDLSIVMPVFAMYLMFYQRGWIFPKCGETYNKTKTDGQHHSSMAEGMCVESLRSWPDLKKAIKITLCEITYFIYNPILKSNHHTDVIMGAMASQITSLTIVYSTVYSGTDERKHQSSASLALWGEFTGDRWIPFDDVIMI